MDANSPLFLSCLAKSTILPSVTLTVLQAGEGGEHFLVLALTRPLILSAARQYTRIIMNKVQVTSQTFGGSSGEDQLTENLTLNVRLALP